MKRGKSLRSPLFFLCFFVVFRLPSSVTYFLVVVAKKYVSAFLQALLPLVIIAFAQALKKTAVSFQNIEIVAVLIACEHEAIKIDKIREAIVNDSVAELLANVVTLRKSYLLISANIEVVACDTLLCAVKLFFSFPAGIGVVYQVVVSVSDIDNSFALVDRFFALCREQPKHLQSVGVCSCVWESKYQVYVVFSVL